MKLYGIKTCDTCRKAIKALPEATFIDLKKEAVPADVLAAAFDQVGEALLNKRGTTWRALSDEAKAQPILEVIAAHPMTMKRPLIEDEGRYTVGWPRP